MGRQVVGSARRVEGWREVRVVARVVVPLEVFQRGQFPPVCVKTGRPAELVGQAEAVAAAGGAWSLVRLLPLLGRWWPASRRARGEVPVTRAAVRRITVLRWAWAAVLLAGVALAGGAGSGSPWMLAAGRVLVALAGVLWLLAPWVTVERRAWTLRAGPWSCMASTRGSRPPWSTGRRARPPRPSGEVVRRPTGGRGAGTSRAGAKPRGCAGCLARPPRSPRSVPRMARWPAPGPSGWPTGPRRG